MHRESAACSGLEHDTGPAAPIIDCTPARIAAAWVGRAGLLYHALRSNLKAHQICIKFQTEDIVSLQYGREILENIKILFIDCKDPDLLRHAKEVVQAIHRSHPHVKVTIFADDHLCAQISHLHDEADLIVKHSASIRQLIDALNLVRDGVAFLPIRRLGADHSQLVAYQDPPRPETISASTDVNVPHPLSRREVRILQSLGAGHSNKVIAGSLSIAESTVKVHVKSILRKIKAENRTQAAVWATANLK